MRFNPRLTVIARKGLSRFEADQDDRPANPFNSRVKLGKFVGVKAMVDDEGYDLTFEFHANLLSGVIFKSFIPRHELTGWLAY
ncbi:MAG: hypothetical protein M1548_03085 [Actinobacteria bacterium]|nr:hypothetical protein [Actinomycetota bacterium]